MVYISPEPHIWKYFVNQYTPWFCLKLFLEILVKKNIHFVGKFSIHSLRSYRKAKHTSPLLWSLSENTQPARNQTIENLEINELVLVGLNVSSVAFLKVMYLLTFTYQFHFFGDMVFNFYFLMSCWHARLETKLSFLPYIPSLWKSTPTCPLLSLVSGLAFFRNWSANHFCCHSKVIWTVFCLPVLIWPSHLVSGHMKIHCNFSLMLMLSMILLKKMDIL